MIRLDPRIPGVLLLFTLGACTSAPRYRTNPVEETAPTIRGRDVVHLAQTYVGAPYRPGGTTKSGIDCSGLVVRVYGELGLALPRTSWAQARFGEEIKITQLQPGDLVFFRTSRTRTVSHVGIYAGGGEFIHASTRSRRVRFDRLDNKYFKKRLVGARRVL